MRRLLRRRWVEIVGVVGGVTYGLLVAVLLDHPALAAGPAAWEWPLAGPAAVVRPFDPPDHRYAAGHRGADLAGSPGAPVAAAGAGRVSYAGLLAGRGVVVVTHGQLRTTYEPVTADVVVGQQVAAGDPLGRLDFGHEGCPAAACLHWGLRRGDDYLDPVQLVDPGPARLLPVDGSAGLTSSRTSHPSQLGAPQEGDAVVPAARAAPERARLALPAAPAPTVSEPHWSVRAAEAPAGAAAVVALAAGLALVARPRRPRRPPDGPAGQGAGGSAASTATAGPGDGAAVGPPVDLDGERARRRAAS